MTLRGLSEFAYDIPLTYLLLVSGSTYACDSLIVEAPERISLAGNYKEGLDNLALFGELAKKIPLTDIELFQQFYTTALAHLNREDIKQEYIFLEMGELYLMTGDADTDNLIWRIEDIRDALEAQDISNLLTSMYGDKTLADNWQEDLGLDNWSEILYFSFPESFPYTTPFEVSDVTIVRRISG